MSEPGPKPATANQPESAQGGALWALIVGGAILVVAALLIFWPGGDAASGAAGAGKGKASGGQQASLAQGGGPETQALGVGARDYDPNRGGGKARVNPGLLPVGPKSDSLAPPKKPKPEPTSFPSAGAEIAYWEKKLDIARKELAQRTIFLERMKKVKDNARTSEQIELAERRGAVVEKNYTDQKQLVEDLERKVAGLKEKQRQSGL
ncbi:hypothetical protein SAMN02745121_04862 [Nannocystis exedens]|uniref:Uncharacterized protein n=1 Tax=Nannocystis exedens TaxID=54 RepID=A0A1I2BYT0_9BACT|nr:hypothetical protein [Nannocystis exedens]PCC71174.1 hypothetical protein NAEX_04248 [Nannocystis exedens]SFE61277.1 hypothetical protein SAMN02745121_04862 [Nannocystis exedens]